MKMDIKQWNEEMYLDFLVDIEIARKELIDMKIFPDQGILCELYAVPSLNFQTYYAVVYENKGRVELAYAKPFIYTGCFDEPIKMYSFKDAKEAEKHPNAEGRIFMGIKRLSLNMELMFTDIMKNIPYNHFSGGHLVSIDGTFQIIRVSKDMKIVKQIAYRNSDEIAVPREKEYLKDVLNDLYIKVGEIIDNIS